MCVCVERVKKKEKEIVCVRKSSCEMEMSRVKGQNCKFDCHISCQSPCPLYSLYPSHTYTNMHTHTIRPATLPAIHSNLQDNQSACSVLFCFVSFPHFLFFFFFFLDYGTIKCAAPQEQAVEISNRFPPGFYT